MITLTSRYTDRTVTTHASPEKGMTLRTYERLCDKMRIRWVDRLVLVDSMGGAINVYNEDGTVNRVIE